VSGHREEIEYKDVAASKNGAKECYPNIERHITEPLGKTQKNARGGTSVRRERKANQKSVRRKKE